MQNFDMGSHEVDTRGLPYGIYDISAEVIVNGQTFSKTIQRVNKVFALPGGRYARGLANLGWKYAYEYTERRKREKMQAKLRPFWDYPHLDLKVLAGWLQDIAITLLLLVKHSSPRPIANYITLSMQNMVTTDRSWSTSSLSLSLHGDLVPYGSAR